MLTEARQKMIADYINQRSLCRVAELCKLTNTSESTIRRDLIQMEIAGVIKRIHGGARSVKNLSRDIAQHVRFDLNHKDKLQIAHYVAENFIHPGDSIFIDAGTTTYEIVPFIAEISNLTLVTNGLETALGSLAHGLETILIGGKVKGDTHAAVGQSALEQISALNFTASFIGTNGLDQNGNLTTPDPEEAAIKRVEIKQATKAYVLTDPTKIGERDFAVFGNVKDVTVITTQLNQCEKTALPAEIKIEEAK